MIKKQNTVNFSDIFVFAEEKFGVGWNSANDLFFNTILEYKRSNKFWAPDIKGMLQDDEFPLEEDYRKAYDIMLAFMENHNVKQLLVLND